MYSATRSHRDLRLGMRGNRASRESRGEPGLSVGNTRTGGTNRDSRGCLRAHPKGRLSSTSGRSSYYGSTGARHNRSRGEADGT